MKREGWLLIVDDNAATRYAMRRVLERQGYRVLEAGAGGEGLAHIAQSPVSVVILDVNLPDMSGFDVARQLRADPQTAVLPIIHVSAASVETRDIISGLDAGADAYLIHPIDPGVLLATLRTQLRVRDAEQALRDSEKRFREIFANITAPIAVIDANLRVHESNQAFQRLLGGDADLQCCFAPGQEAVIEEMRARLRARERWRSSLRVQVDGGQLHETEWLLSPYRLPDQGLLLVEDVTEQRRRERLQLKQLDAAQLQLAQEVAERARTEAQLLQAQKMDALGQLTGGIAHDFNNLLTGIITGIGLLKQRAASGRIEDVLRYADMALGSANNAAALTHRLLAFARQQPLDSRAVDVNERVHSLEDFMRRTIGERIQLSLDLTSHPAVALVDPVQLDNALLNLVINARDALPEGGHIHITSYAAHSQGSTELRDGDYVALSVRDDGVGIDPKLLHKVFDPFFTTKPLGQGTGLGLSTIYGFARQSGGEVRISSVLGQGTEVTLLLPAAAEVAVNGVDRATQRHNKGGSEHVLIVEDMPAVRLLVTELLTDAGYRCTPLADASEALALLEQGGGVDLLLTDVGLPKMGGTQLAEAARHLLPALPVLFMTGYAEKTVNRSNLLQVRMDVLTKPFEPAALLERVRQLLDEATD
ncbi:response regulator [Stutzerimonas balearica]|uniref:response regulator n=1 Tax=Stutzerimonas balearica TaxID=74829 RepID=UPI00289759C6|nr:response regulator [Stutzerimonas balearica]